MFTQSPRHYYLSYLTDNITGYKRFRYQRPIHVFVTANVQSCLSLLSSNPCQGSARPSFDFRDQIHDSHFQSLNFKTESETQIFLVSVSRPSPRLEFSESQF